MIVLQVQAHRAVYQKLLNTNNTIKDEMKQKNKDYRTKKDFKVNILDKKEVINLI